MLTTVRTGLAARPAWQIRTLKVLLFVALTAISARLRIDLPGNPVPITAQTFVVWLAGLSLGATDGALSQIVYVGLIALGAPIDARGLGPAVFVSPTVGYLLGFIPGAFVAGLGTHRGLGLKILGAFGGAAVIHLCGMLGLFLMFHSWAVAVSSDIQFIPVDFGKALLAAALVNLSYVYRQSRQGPTPPTSA